MYYKPVRISIHIDAIVIFFAQEELLALPVDLVC
jgi:hypothetical protein